MHTQNPPEQENTLSGFSAVTNWPKGLLDIFSIFRKENVPYESRYYGPYDRLLNYALEDDLTLFVAPQKAPPDDPFPREDALAVRVFCFIVMNKELKPVLIAEVKEDSWADEPYTRWLADARMRQRYDQLMPDCPIPRLYGLSLLGTSLRVYCGDKVTGELTPDVVRHSDEDGTTLPSNYLEGEWDLDFLSQDGLKKIQEIFAYIKAEVAK